MLNVQVKDSRNGKVYLGKLTTNITVGQPVKVMLPDGKHELHIVPLQRCLRSGMSYWLVDKNGVQFILKLI